MGCTNNALFFATSATNGLIIKNYILNIQNWGEKRQLGGGGDIPLPNSLSGLFN